MSDFTGKYVIVTGAGEGIGLGICQAFAKAGAIVGLNDIKADVARASADRMNTEIGDDRVHALPCDVADTQAVSEMVAQFSQNVGVPDIIVANAGITRYIEFLETTPDMFDRIVAVNQRGSYFLAQASAKQMIAHNKRGRIIMMSSVVGIQTHINFSVYSMTKAAIQMMAKSLALELGSHGITVNSITPGATLTPRVVREDPNYAENWAGVSITEQVGTIDDIASAVLFLSSDNARQITGHNLVVDGGWTIQSPLPPSAPTKPVGDD